MEREAVLVKKVDAIVAGLSKARDATVDTLSRMTSVEFQLKHLISEAPTLTLMSESKTVRSRTNVLLEGTKKAFDDTKVVAGGNITYSVTKGLVESVSDYGRVKAAVVRVF